MRSLVGGLVLLALACLTAQRVTVWQSEIALWTEAVERSPWKPRPWSNLGRAWAIEGQRDSAIVAYETAARLAQLPGRSAWERRVTARIVTLNIATLRLGTLCVTDTC